MRIQLCNRLILFSLMILTATSGCRTTTSPLHSAVSRFDSGQTSDALKQLQLADERDDAEAELIALDRAVVQLMAGQPVAAESELRVARKQLDYLAQRDAKESALSVVTDDHAVAWSGREYERLSSEVFTEERVGLIHGQLSGAEKDRVMRAFLAGDLDVLVATTVIEVGIDVPNASVMIIEHAERFGLSQLHQLRGRVGRGAAESHCILIAEPGEDALERLREFRDTTDGFEVARADLRIRGQGDLFGSQQHGRDPALRFANLLADEDLLVEAQREARAIVAGDPDLERPEHARIRDHLHARYQHRLAMYGVG